MSNLSQSKELELINNYVIKEDDLDRGREGDVVQYKEYETYKFSDSGRYVPTKEGLIQEIRYLERKEE